MTITREISSQKYFKLNARIHKGMETTCSSAFTNVKPFRSSLGIVSSSKSKTLESQDNNKALCNSYLKVTIISEGRAGLLFTCHSNHLFYEQLAQSHTAWLSSAAKLLHQ
jgi:hypothetical protein